MGQLLVATLCTNCKTNIQLINIGIGPHIDFVLLLCLLWNAYIYVVVILMHVVNCRERALSNVVRTSVWSHFSLISWKF